MLTYRTFWKVGKRKHGYSKSKLLNDEVAQMVTLQMTAVSTLHLLRTLQGLSLRGFFFVDERFSPL